MEIKHTKDGKKVAIISKVNSDQFVVQEIFIVENNEVPHGECFVVRSSDLKDEYVSESWHARQLKREEEQYKKRESEIERSLKEINRRYRQACKVMEDKTKFLKELSKKINLTMFDSVIDLIEGKIKFLVINEYGNRYKIQGFNSAIYNGDNSYDSIKLLTLYGRDDGSLSLHLNCYGDGSGSYSYVFPFKSYEAAILFVKEKLLSLPQYDYTTIETAEKYSIELNSEIVKKYWEERVQEEQKRIDEDVVKLEKRKNELDKIKRERMK